MGTSFWQPVTRLPVVPIRYTLLHGDCLTQYKLPDIPLFAGGADMSERLYFDRPDVYVLADFNPRTGGQARHVVCEHPDGTSYAAQLAASMGVPVRGPVPADEAGRDSQPSDGQESGSAGSR